MRKLLLTAGCGAILFASQPSQATTMYECFQQFQEVIQAEPLGSLIMAENHYGRRISDAEYVRYWVGQAVRTCSPW